jgi:hypothetical protein
MIPVPKRTKEWIEKINDFETTLKKRNLLLVKLKEFQVEEAI